MSRPLVIFGIGDMAEVAAMMFNLDSPYEVAAFTVNAEHATSESFCGKSVVDFERLTELYPPAEYELFVAVGYSGMNRHRAAICAAAKARGYRLASYVSSRAITWPDFSIGENCMILEQVNIQPGVKIGDNTIIWSANHIGHHSVIGCNVYLTSHVVIAGRVTIGDNAFLGVNSTIRDHVTVGAFSLIGAGCYVSQDTPENAVMRPPKTVLSRADSRQIKI